MARRHTLITEPTKDDDGNITWSGTCTCGKWAAIGLTEVEILYTHYRHWLEVRPVSPELVHLRNMAMYGRMEEPNGS